MQYLQDCPPVAQSEQTHALESRPRAQWNMYSSKPQLSHDIGKHRDFQMPQNANMSSPLLRVDVPSVYRPVSCEAVIMGTFASRSDIRSPTSTGTDVATTTTSVDGGAIDPLTWSQNVQYQQPPALGYAAQSQSGNSLFWPQLAQSSFSSTDSGSFAAQYSALQSRSGPETNIAWQTQPDWNHTTHCPFCHRWVAWPQHNLGMVDAGRATQTFQAIDQGISNSASNVTFPAPNDLRPTAPAIGAPACNKILRGMQYADAQGNLNSQTWSEVTSVESATSIASDSSVASTADSAESPAYFQEANASTDARGNHNGTDPGKYCNASTHNSDCHDSSEAKDDFLVQARLQGMAYKKIKEKGHFQEAESTLRGRFRCLTKAKKQRVRQPRWTEDDVSLQSMELHVMFLILITG